MGVSFAVCYQAGRQVETSARTATVMPAFSSRNSSDAHSKLAENGDFGSCTTICQARTPEHSNIDRASRTHAG
jgi:hypothetical protein